MVSYTNLFLIKGMSCWNIISGWTSRISRWIQIKWETTRQHFHPDRGAWFLYSHSLFPVSYRDHYGLDTAEWKYNPGTNTLQWRGKGREGEKEKEKEKEKNETYRLGWLSAQTRGGGEIKDMDGFLNGLCIETTGPSPTLMVLLQAWSVYERKWWSADPSVRIEWIDTLAEEHSAGPMDSLLPPLVKVVSKKKN